MERGGGQCAISALSVYMPFLDVGLYTRFTPLIFIGSWRSCPMVSINSVPTCDYALDIFDDVAGQWREAMDKERLLRIIYMLLFRIDPCTSCISVLVHTNCLHSTSCHLLHGTTHSIRRDRDIATQRVLNVSSCSIYYCRIVRHIRHGSYFLPFCVPFSLIRQPPPAEWTTISTRNHHTPLVYALHCNFHVGELLRIPESA